MENNKIILQPGQRIRTLGLYQPFATLMLHGKIETRWVGSSRNGKLKKPPFPFGKYLIYSTKKAYDYFEVLNIAGKHHAEILKLEAGEDWATYHLKGCAICIGDLVDIIDPIKKTTKNTFVKYAPALNGCRRVGLVFQNIQRIKPFEFKGGKQGIGFLHWTDVEKIEII
jgi:hypothetical protein